MPLDFPGPPLTVGQTWTGDTNNVSYAWDGTKWVVQSSLTTQLAQMPVINVLDHAAKGDGVTDDTAAIQNVLNTYAGKAVTFVPDTGHPYMVRNLTVPTGTDCLIHGTLKFTGAPNAGSMINVTNVNNVTFRGHGVLDGNSASQAVFYTNNATNVQLSGLTVQNAYYWNLNVVGSTSVHVDSVRLLGGNNSNEFAIGCNHCWITNSYINGVAQDESFTFYSGCTNCGITNCEVSNGYISGISVFADAAGGNVAPCSNITISNNIVHGCKEAGIEVRTGDAGPAVNHTAITITGNRCYGNSASGNIWFGEIWLQSGSGLTVTGNNLSATGSGNAGSTGILVGSNTSDVTITGNAIWNIGQGSTQGVGIFLQNAPDVLIEGNHIYDNQTTHTMVGAFSGSAGVRNSILNNMCSGIASNLGFGTLGCGLAADTVVLNNDNEVSWRHNCFNIQGVLGVGVGNGKPSAASWQFQGGYIGWNYAGNGMTNFVNSQGAGPGGFNFYNVASSPSATPTLLGTLDANAVWHIGAGVTYSFGTVNSPAIGFNIDATTNALQVYAGGTLRMPTSAANDAAAATAGVPVGGTYRNGSILMIRVA